MKKHTKQFRSSRPVVQSLECRRLLAIVPAGPATVVVTNTYEFDQTSTQSFRDVSAAADGHFVAVVSDYNLYNGDTQFYLQLYNADQSPRGGKIYVTPVARSDTYAVDVEMMADGRFAVLIKESPYDFDTDTVTTKLTIRRFTPAGVQTGADLTAFAGTYSYLTTGVPNTALSLDTDGDMMVLLNTSNGQNEGGYTVSSLGFRADGTPIPQKLLATTTDTLIHAYLRVDRNDEFVVTWDETDQTLLNSGGAPDSSISVFAQRFKFGGTPLTPLKTVVTGIPSSGFMYRMASNRQGNTAFVWGAAGNSSEFDGSLFYRGFDASGTFSSAAPVRLAAPQSGGYDSANFGLDFLDASTFGVVSPKLQNGLTISRFDLAGRAIDNRPGFVFSPGVSGINFTLTGGPAGPLVSYSAEFFLPSRQPFDGFVFQRFATSSNDDSLTATVSGKVLTVVGSSAPDVIRVSRVGGNVNVNIQTKVFTFAASSVSSIHVLGLGGSDSLTIDSSIFLATVLDGGDGDDTIAGGSGSNLVDGSDGNDVITGGNSSDDLYGGQGNDEVHGGRENDFLRGNKGQDTLFGDAENDTLLGGLGDDMLLGGIGNDFNYGDAGNDNLIDDEGNDQLSGGVDNDRYFFPVARIDQTDFAYDSEQGGVDLISFSSLPSDDPVTIDLTPSRNIAQHKHRLVNLNYIENVAGGLGNDTITGDDGPNSLSGGSGDDKIFGLGNADVLRGDAGNDYLDGGTGYNYLYGLNQQDTLLAGRSDNDTLVGGKNSDRLFGGQGNDQLFGGTGNDKLDGGLGADLLDGGADNDTLFGQDGAATDTLDGGAGTDVLGSKDPGDLVVSIP